VAADLKGLHHACAVTLNKALAVALKKHSIFNTKDRKIIIELK